MTVAKPWENKNILSADHAREIININIPEINIDSIRLLGQGWDNTTWLVNENLCVRFPKHNQAAMLLTNEIRVLSKCIKTNLFVPVPKYICLSPSLFQYPFYCHDFIDGLTADRANLSRANRIQIVEKLAHFLKDLHNTPIDKCISIGIHCDEVCRLNFKNIYAEISDRIEYLEKRNLLPNNLNIKKFYKKNMNVNIPDFVTLCHGDLYAKHLIIDNDKSLCGIIDWGDSELLHPAIDLAIVYQFLPKESHLEFWNIYGNVENEIHIIAILRAIYSSVTISWYAHQVNDKCLFDEGILSLQMINETL